MQKGGAILTNREHIISLLHRSDPDAMRYLMDLFGCQHISAEQCVQQENCVECWKHWLESEATNNDHA